MNKPKHLSDECWKHIVDSKYNQFCFGFAEAGEILEIHGINYKFVGNFGQKKDATALKSETCCVHPYLYGKLKIGWVVWERV